jgi:predicted secreted protein
LDKKLADYLKEYDNISKKEAKFIMSYLKELTPSGIELEFISISSF